MDEGRLAHTRLPYEHNLKGQKVKKAPDTRFPEKNNQIRSEKLAKRGPKKPTHVPPQLGRKVSELIDGRWAYPQPGRKVS